MNSFYKYLIFFIIGIILSLYLNKDIVEGYTCTNNYVRESCSSWRNRGKVACENNSGCTYEDWCHPALLGCDCDGNTTILGTGCDDMNAIQCSGNNNCTLYPDDLREHCTDAASEGCVCYGGYERLHNSKVCTICINGTAGSDGTCTSCNPGKYSSSVSQGEGVTIPLSCTSCPGGKYSDTHGATECTSCPAGKYSTHGATECTSCPPGKYSTQGAIDCTSCPAGKYSDTYGATECTSCPAGKYSTQDAIECTSCPAGKYSDTREATSDAVCLDCPAGSETLNVDGYYTTTEATQCVNCAPGSHSTAGGQCESCPIERPYQSIDRTDCVSCDRQIYNQLTRSCISCTGNKVPNTSHSACVDCDSDVTDPPGTGGGPGYKSNSDNSACYNPKCNLPDTPEYTIVDDDGLLWSENFNPSINCSPGYDGYPTAACGGYGQEMVLSGCELESDYQFDSNYKGCKNFICESSGENNKKKITVSNSERYKFMNCDATAQATDTDTNCSSELCCENLICSNYFSESGDSDPNKKQCSEDTELLPDKYCKTKAQCNINSHCCSSYLSDDTRYLYGEIKNYCSPQDENCLNKESIRNYLYSNLLTSVNGIQVDGAGETEYEYIKTYLNGMPDLANIVLKEQLTDSISSFNTYSSFNYTWIGKSMGQEESAYEVYSNIYNFIQIYTPDAIVITLDDIKLFLINLDKPLRNTDDTFKFAETSSGLSPLDIFVSKLDNMNEGIFQKFL